MQRNLLTRKNSILSAVVLLTVLGLASSAFAAAPPAGVQLVASGSVSSNGTLQIGTPNITTSYNTATGMYQIHINGVCFLRTSYTTVATVSGYNGYPQGALFVNTDDDGNFCKSTGDMVVGLRDVNGNLQQADFQFMIIQK